MSDQSLTYEGVLAMIREGIRETQEFRRSLKEQSAEFRQLMKERDAEFDRRMVEHRAEYARERRELNKKIGDLGNSIGRIIEHMVAGNNIIRKFKALDYEIESHSRNKKFGHTLPKDLRGEIDLFLENGDIAILVEVKTTL